MRILKARRLPPKRPRSKVATPARVEALHQRMSRVVTASFKDGIRAFRERISPEKMMRAFMSGNYNHLMNTIPWHHLPTDLQKTQEDLEKAGHAGAKVGHSMFPEEVKPTLRWDAQNPRIRTNIATRTGSLITVVQEGAMEAVRAATTRALSGAVSPRQVADEIVGSIGLNRPQARALSNYRDMLQDQGDHDPETQDKLASQMEDRMLDSRAMTIARTEVRGASNTGQLEMWLAAQEDGLLPDSAQKVWVIDGNPCPICIAMDGVQVPIADPWVVKIPTKGGGSSNKECAVPTESHPNCECIMTLDAGD